MNKKINFNIKLILIILIVILLIILILILVFKNNKSEKYYKPSYKPSYERYSEKESKIKDYTSLQYLINVSKNTKLNVKDYEQISREQLQYLEKNEPVTRQIFPNTSKSLKKRLKINLPIPTPQQFGNEVVQNIDSFTTGMTDVGKSLATDVFQKLFKGTKQSWRDLAIDASIQTGIVVVSLTLTCLGLGFANPLLNMFSPYQYKGDFPIDIKKIPFTMEQELLKQSLNFCNADISKTIIYYNNIYLTAKLQINTNSLCNLNNTNSENLQCIKDPEFDPNIVKPSMDARGVYKRVILTDMLGVGTPPYVMFNTSNYSFEFISLNFDNNNILLSVELYKAYKLITGLEITYYQELALVDTLFKGDYFLNPWESRYLGDMKIKASQQIGGTLLGQLQIRCQKIFDMIRILMKKYFQNLYWIHICHGNQASKSPTDVKFSPDISFSCKIYTNYYFLEDRNFVIEESEFHHTQQPVPKQDAESSQNNDFVKADINWKAKSLLIFYKYLNDPLESLQELKKMAGIKYLKGEQNYLQVDANGLYNFYYDAAGKTYETNDDIIFDDLGGYPFGIGFPSYSEVINVKKDPLKYRTLEDTIRFKNYCTPSIPVNMRNACSDLKFEIDATIFNGDSADKTYTKNMICDGNSYQSCLLPGMSPGDKHGNYISNSRTAFCVDNNLLSYPLENNRNKCINEDVINSYDITHLFQTYVSSKYPDYDFSEYSMVLNIGAYKQSEHDCKASIKIYQNPNYNSEDKFEYIQMDDSYDASYSYDSDDENGLQFSYNGKMIIAYKNTPSDFKNIDISFYFKIFQNHIKELFFNIACFKMYNQYVPPLTTPPPTTMIPTTLKPIINYDAYDIKKLFTKFLSTNHLYYNFTSYDIILYIADNKIPDIKTKASINFILKPDGKNIYENIILDPDYNAYYILGRDGLYYKFQGTILIKVIDSPFGEKKIPINFHFKVFEDSIKEENLDIVCQKL